MRKVEQLSSREMRLHKIRENQPEGVTDIVRMRDIIIPEEFKNHPPRATKINKCARYYRFFGMFDEPVTLIAETNENGKSPKFILVDGYVRYWLATRFGFKWIGAKYLDINKYIIK